MNNLRLSFIAVVLNLGSIEPLGLTEPFQWFDEGHPKHDYNKI